MDFCLQAPELLELLFARGVVLSWTSHTIAPYQNLNFFILYSHTHTHIYYWLNTWKFYISWVVNMTILFFMALFLYVFIWPLTVFALPWVILLFHSSDNFLCLSFEKEHKQLCHFLEVVGLGCYPVVKSFLLRFFWCYILRFLCVLLVSKLFRTVPSLVLQCLQFLFARFLVFWFEVCALF